MWPVSPQPQHVTGCPSYDTKTMCPATDIWDGRCLDNFIVANLITLATLYRYAFDHSSSWSAMISPYGASAIRRVRSDVSGGRLAILIRHFPIPAISRRTIKFRPSNACIPYDCLYTVICLLHNYHPQIL